MPELKGAISRKGTSKWKHEEELQAAAMAEIDAEQVELNVDEISVGDVPTAPPGVLLDEWGFPIEEPPAAPTQAAAPAVAQDVIEDIAPVAAADSTDDIIDTVQPTDAFKTRSASAEDAADIIVDTVQPTTAKSPIASAEDEYADDFERVAEEPALEATVVDTVAAFGATTAEDAVADAVAGFGAVTVTNDVTDTVADTAVADSAVADGFGTVVDSVGAHKVVKEVTVEGGVAAAEADAEDEYGDDFEEVDESALEPTKPVAPSTFMSPVLESSPASAPVWVRPSTAEAEREVTKYLDETFIDVARDVIITRAIANNRRVMMSRVQSKHLKPEECEPELEEVDMADAIKALEAVQATDSAATEHKEDTAAADSTELGMAASSLLEEPTKSSPFNQPIHKQPSRSSSQDITHSTAAAALHTSLHSTTDFGLPPTSAAENRSAEHSISGANSAQLSVADVVGSSIWPRDSESKADAVEATAAGAEPPAVSRLQGALAAFAATKAGAAPQSKVAKGSKKMLKRAHTQVDAVVPVVPAAAPVEPLGGPSEGPLERARSDAAGLNPAWLPKHDDYMHETKKEKPHSKSPGWVDRLCKPKLPSAAAGVAKGPSQGPVGSQNHSASGTRAPTQLSFTAPPKPCKPSPVARPNMSFSPGRLWEIERDNDLLMRKLLAISPGISRPPSQAMTYTIKQAAHPSASSYRRRAYEKRVVQENHALFDRLTHVTPSPQVDRRRHAEHFAAHCVYQHQISQFQPLPHPGCSKCKKTTCHSTCQSPGGNTK